MKTDTLKKSLLDYAIKGSLTAKFRRENAGLNAFDELEIYNEAIKEKHKNLEKELKKCEKEFKLEKDKEQKALFKSQIQMLKKELTKCKEITPLNSTEAPFTIPNSWAWVKLGDICEIISGGTPSRDKIEYWHNGTIPWVKIADVKNNVVNQTQEFITELGLENSSAKIFKKGTLLYTIFATLGETAILNIDAATNQAIAALIETYDYDTKFLMYCLMSMKDYVNSLGRGVAQNNINQTMLKNFTIPLPPLYEQQEIVKKLDLLVTLANDFAITKENLKRIEKRIEKSLLKLALEGSLSKLYRRSSPTLCAFNEINTYNEAIKEKRKKLEKELKKCEKEFKLEKDKEQKALFKSQIQMLKKELTKCKEITPLFCHTEPLGEVSNNTESKRDFSPTAQNAVSLENDNPHTPSFEIPNSWAWVKLGDICEINPKNDISDNVEISFIPMALIADSCQNTFTYELKLWKEVKGGFTHLRDNSVAFAKISPCFENGKSFVVKNLKNGYGAGTTELIVLLPHNPLLKEYVFYCVNSAFFVNQALKTFKGTAGQQRLNMDFVENFTIPLPPLCEQEHIVQTLDTLFTLKKGLRVE